MIERGLGNRKQPRSRPGITQMSLEQVEQKPEKSERTSNRNRTPDWSPDHLPFEHLNLRRNPFGSVPEADRPQLAVVDLGGLIEHLRERNTAVEFVGERGRGKSTHLLMLHRRFPDHPKLYACREQSVDVPDDSFPFIDEFQRVEPPKRSRFYRRAGRLVVGTHRSFADELEAHGFNVHTVHPGTDDPDRLKTIIDRRIEWARRDEGPVPELPVSEIRKLSARFGTDLRSMFDHLYDVFQQLEGPGRVQL